MAYHYKAIWDDMKYMHKILTTTGYAWMGNWWTPSIDGISSANILKVHDYSQQLSKKLPEKVRFHFLITAFKN
jgi:hypothetical protein